MNKFKSSYEYRDFYNKFIKKYNKKNDKLNAISEIKTQRDLLSDKEKRDKEKVSDHLSKLIAISKLPIFPVNPGENELNILNMKALKKVQDKFKDYIASGYHIVFSEYSLQFLKEAIEESVPTESIRHYPASECMKKAEIICSLGESIEKCREKQKHLNRLIDQAIEANYPTKLKKWEDPSNEEELRGAALKLSEKKVKKKNANMPDIIKAANQVVGDKKLSDFTTKNGNANSKLYKGILRKHQEVTEGTLKRWLNEDIKSGEFEKKLNEYRENLKNNQSVDQC